MGNGLRKIHLWIVLPMDYFANSFALDSLDSNESPVSRSFSSDLVSSTYG